MKRSSIQIASSSGLALLAAITVNLGSWKGISYWVVLGVLVGISGVLVALDALRTEQKEQTEPDPDKAYRRVIFAIYVQLSALTNRLRPLFELPLRVLPGNSGSLSSQSITPSASDIIIGSQDFIRSYVSDPNRVLIVGPAGSGKTSILAQLGAKLANSAQVSESKYIPLLVRSADLQFKDPSSVDEKLTDIFRRACNTSLQLSRRILSVHPILPLFDGLDEIQPEYRDQVLYGICRWLSSRPGQPAVLTCRTSEYRAILQQITVDSVMSIEPLPASEVANYLAFTGQSEHEGDDRIASRALADLLELREEARRPALLDFLVSSFKSQSGSNLEDYSNIDIRQLIAAGQKVSGSSLSSVQATGTLLDHSRTTEGAAEQQVLAALEPAVSYDIGQISSAAGLTPSTCKRVLESLIARGLIKEVEDNRGRQRYVRIIENEER